MRTGMDLTAREAIAMSDETKHSAEPWTRRRGSKADAGMNEVVVNSTGVVVCATVPQAAETDARRIVACVNACQDLPTAALEAGALAKALDVLAQLGHGVSGHQYVTTAGPCRLCAADAALRSLGRLP